MHAMMLEHNAPVEQSPLKGTKLKAQDPGHGEVLIKVRSCGVCRTDLHIIEGELKAKTLPIVPGHQIVGEVEAVGSGVQHLKKGDRVGVGWINSTCGKCHYCTSGRENLCEHIKFTGYDVNGGYAAHVVANEGFAYHLPESFDDVHAAPLLCAGVIGFRAFRLADAKHGETLALYGFGSSAHIVTQVARHGGIDVLAFSRGTGHRMLARDLGASWAGATSDEPPKKADAAIIFAPAGPIVLDALRNLKPGGRVVIADIYMTPIPQIDYNALLYKEKSVMSVTNYTRKDATDFLKLASEMPMKTEIHEFKLDEANIALQMLKSDKIKGSAVLRI